MPNSPRLSKVKPWRGASRKWETWPTKGEVPRAYRVTPHRVAAAVRTGSLIAHLCPDQNVRFDPADLRRVFGVRVEPAAAAEEEREAELQGEPIALEPPQATLLQLYKLLVDVLAEVRDEKKQLLGLLTQPMQVGVGLLVESLKAANARVAEVEKARDQTYLEREKLISENALRDAMQRKLARQDEMWKRLGETFHANAGKLVEALATRGTANEALQFLLRLDPNIVRMARESGLVSPADAAWIDKLERMRKTEPPPAAAEANGVAQTHSAAEAPEQPKESEN